MRVVKPMLVMVGDGDLVEVEPEVRTELERRVLALQFEDHPQADRRQVSITRSTESKATETPSGASQRLIGGQSTTRLKPARAILARFRACRRASTTPARSGVRPIRGRSILAAGTGSTVIRETPCGKDNRSRAGQTHERRHCPPPHLAGQRRVCGTTEARRHGEQPWAGQDHCRGSAHPVHPVYP